MKKLGFLAVAMILGLSTIGCTEEKKPATPPTTTPTTPADGAGDTNETDAPGESS